MFRLLMPQRDSTKSVNWQYYMTGSNHANNAWKCPFRTCYGLQFEIISVSWKDELDMWAIRTHGFLIHAITWNIRIRWSNTNSVTYTSEVLQVRTSSDNCDPLYYNVRRQFMKKNWGRDCRNSFCSNEQRSRLFSEYFRCLKRSILFNQT